MNGMIDALIGLISGRGRSVKRKREVNTKYHITTVKPLESRYSYGSEIDKRTINRARRRVGHKR